MHCCYLFAPKCPFNRCLIKGFTALFITVLLSACGGGASTSAPVLNLPDIPDSPISKLILSNNYIGFLIASNPMGLDPRLATSQQFTQRLYQLDIDNNITPVAMLDQLGAEVDFAGNATFTETEGIIPLDVMIMSPEYIMLTVFHRNFDLDPDNDYFNLLVHLRTGTVVEAPVGLNQQGNSGRSTLTTLGRDYFPPDARWNDTEDLYVVGVDFDALDLMVSGGFEEDPDHQEPVDHHSGVPCPVVEEETGTTDSGESDTTDTTGNASSDTSAETSDTTDTGTADTATDTTDTSTDSATDGTDTTTDTTSTSEMASNCVDHSSTATDTTTDTTDDASQTANAITSIITPASNFSPSARALEDDEEPPTPTAIYRMRLGENSSYGLEKISAEDDRPGLGQFIASRSGIVIYRNLDGGDNSYRVLLEHCEGVTGRLSTVLIALNTSLIVADDAAGNSSIFEVTERGMNKLVFSCNGNVERRAFSGYSTGISSLKLPFNSTTIASYDFQYPYFINDSCQGGRLFPQQVPVTQVLNPMPSIPGLEGQDVRGLRKSQIFNGNLYCIGYNSALQLSVARLTPSDPSPAYNFLNFNFNQWLPDFDTVHVLGNNQVIFTGITRTSPDINTVILDVDGTITNLNDTLGGLKVAQQIDITPPQNTPTATTTGTATTP